MKLHAVFEIEPTQEKWFRDRLPRLAEEINHGGLEITISERPVPFEEPAAAAPVSEPEAAAAAEAEASSDPVAVDESEIEQPVVAEILQESPVVPLTRGRARRRAVTV